MMDMHDYRVIMTIASNIAQKTYCNGEACYLLDLKQFINAVDNIYPDICIPVARNGVILNPKAEDEEEE
jgi:hypothetical protein